MKAEKQEPLEEEIVDNLKELGEKLAENGKEREKLLSELKEVIRQKLIKCERCKKKSRLSDWTFIQRQFYVYQHGYARVDYWVNKETIHCYIRCPKCLTEIYLNLYQHKKKVMGLLELSPFNKEHLFKAVEVRQRE